MYETERFECVVNCLGGQGKLYSWQRTELIEVRVGCNGDLQSKSVRLVYSLSDTLLRTDILHVYV